MPGLVHFVMVLLQVFSLLLLVRIVMSWMNVDPRNEFLAVLHQITEPVLEPVRRVIPPLGMIDISPLIVFVVLHLIRSMLADMASRM